MVAELTASQQRSADSALVASLSFSSLLAKLPLSLPHPPDCPPAPKPRYRSQYTYLGHNDLLEPAVWATLSSFDLALRLIDFSSLEAPLARIVYAPSAKGHVPFHPVSMFLLHSWRILSRWHRTETLGKLAEARYDDYRQAFGFFKGIYPTEGGLRHFETMLGRQNGNELIAQTVELARAIGILSQRAIERGTFSVDGMIHDAASRMRCSSVDDACYKARSESAPRVCRAKEEKGRKGCDCTAQACKQICQHATPRDPKARFIVYAGHNQSDSPNTPADAADKQSPRGEPRYGYRTVCGRLIDPSRRDSFVLAHGLLGANAPEDKLATELMEWAVKRYDWVDWKFAVADAGEGREPFLTTAYQLGLRRVVGRRSDQSDADKDKWAIRGYDDKGRPICPFGFRLCPNGWDAQRHRYKWCCRHACERQTERPAPDCAHRFDGDKHGLVRDIGLSFADGKTRLVRDIPYDSPLGKNLYARGRNAAEERNSEFEDLGLKRMPVYGWRRVQAVATVVDMWTNLKTIVRLIREATLAAAGLSPP